MRQLKGSLRSALTKNGPELQAFLTGRMPSFVTHANGRAVLDGVPVFFFHDVEPDRFEAQLRYLQSNGYATLDADQLEARLRRPDRSGRRREVALTFANDE
jgi:peptidoglycan/xylan/chitin deacetylase (PgdA/CDA1 family)